MLGVAVLLLMVVVLSASSITGVYAYRQLARSVSTRATELPLAADLSRYVSDLRVTLHRAREAQQLYASLDQQGVNFTIHREEFGRNLEDVSRAFHAYRDQLADNSSQEAEEASANERQTVEKIATTLGRIIMLYNDEGLNTESRSLDHLSSEVDELRNLTEQLPRYLHRRMHGWADRVRGQYRTLIVLTWVTTALAVLMLLSLGRYFYLCIFRPLQLLVHGSRTVVLGDFDHRIQLHTGDEMAELAAAMNAMTRRFCEIRNDLNEQVKQRTKEVVRSEQLASVGFLAAGVAHEINNPLASIAFSAESLEARLEDSFGEADDVACLSQSQREELVVLRRLLQGIEEEAFRCKGITEKLLDFSRLGDQQRERTELHELVSDVVDMVRVVGKYREKHIAFETSQLVMATVCAPEIKQVVLNLVTNALDSLDPGGQVWIELQRVDPFAELVVRDNGCGMTEEVMNHLFQPFFTRRRDGSGTGLGLSITYQIINEHHGRILVHSEGPGRGSEFRVLLPLAADEQEKPPQAA